jgi:hypothetical protein
MQPHIFLTVIDEGPMDGLTYHLKNDISEYSLGRSDNNYFFFPFDKKMSKLHAKLMFSSKNSAGYIMDMDSEWGVWIDGVKLNPGKYYELKWGQILLLGSTIIKVCKQDNAICHSENSYEFFFRDPGFLYKFSDPLKEAWEIMLQKCRLKKFCDVRSLVESLVSQNFKNQYKSYQCIHDMSIGNHHSRPEWLKSIRTEPVYSFKTSDFITPPRIWQIFKRAAENHTDQIEIQHLLKAVIHEQEIPAAHYIKQDKEFLLDFRIFMQMESVSQGESQPSVFNKEKYYLERFRQILTSFLEDAIHPDFTEHDFSPFSQHDYESLITAFITILKIYKNAAYETENKIYTGISDVLSNIYSKRPGKKVKNTIESINLSLHQLKDEIKVEDIIRHMIKNKM